ncbi:MAG: hypothetical protein A2W19_07365 [Spirochaetes bacterium RBG_16_49_21]|nr:MAG: hypothetical protein A2W19_07365 [Spirochaetes bacterium RBG_16_49_21]
MNIIESIENFIYLRDQTKNLIKEVDECEAQDLELLRRVDDVLRYLGTDFGVGQQQLNLMKSIYWREAADAALARSDNDAYLIAMAEYKTFNAKLKENQVELEAMKKAREKLNVLWEEATKPKSGVCPACGAQCGGR